MTKNAVVLCLLLAGSMFAQEGSVPKGVPSLDHVFVIMMENHGYSQIVGNPSAPFANQYAQSANSATNYFAIGHPSSTNYLEIVGGSNFGDRSDNGPDWHNGSCTPNIVPPGYLTTDFPSSSNVCPIAGEGIDAATPAIDLTNECPSPSTADPCPPGLIDIDGSSYRERAPALSWSRRPRPRSVALAPFSNCMPRSTIRSSTSRACRMAMIRTTVWRTLSGSKAKAGFTTISPRAAFRTCRLSSRISATISTAVETAVRSAPLIPSPMAPRVA